MLQRLGLRARLGVALLLIVPQVGAHVPHDVVHRLVLSPAFADDQTLLAFVQLSDHALLARSTDGGLSFTEYGAPMLAHGLVDLELSPQFAGDATLFAATREAGVFRSTDGGLHWEATNAGLGSVVVHDVALSPDFAADRTLLAGTDAGLWRSTDAGLSWHAVGAGLVEAVVGRVAFAPDDVDAVLLGDRVLHRSLDGGVSCVPVAAFPDRIAPIAFARDGVAALAFERAPGGVQLTLDGGWTWAPMLDGLGDVWVNSVAITADRTFFAATRTAGCFRSAGPGEPWQLFDQGFEALSDQTSNHFVVVVPSPGFVSDGRVFVGAFEGLFVSADRGESFTQCDLYHQRIHRRMVLSPDFAHDGLVWASNYGGGPTLGRPAEPGRTTDDGPSSTGKPAPAPGSLAKLGAPPLGAPAAGPSASVGRSVAWEARASGISSLHGSALAISPDYAHDRTLFHGYLGLWRSQDEGRRWTKLACPAPIIRAVALSPEFALDRTLFVGSGGFGTFRSDDAGATWTELGGGLPPDLEASQLALAPDHPEDGTLFVATQAHGLWRSLDGGTSFHAVGAEIGCDSLRCVALSPDFAHDRLVLAGSVGEGLHRSDDGGSTWTPVHALLPPGGDDILECIAFSPDFAIDRTVFVASLVHGVLRSTDGALTFHAAQGGLPIDAPRALCVSPDFAHDATLLVATHDGIWRSLDRGDTWNRLPGYTRIDERHHGVRELGPWTSASLPDCHGLGVRQSSVPGASSEVLVSCDVLAFHAPRDPGAGIAQIVLDGEPVALVDLYAPTPIASQPVFVRRFTDVGWHTLSVVVTGSRHPASSGVVVRTDGFSSRD